MYIPQHVLADHSEVVSADKSASQYKLQVALATVTKAITAQITGYHEVTDCLFQEWIAYT